MTGRIAMLLGAVTLLAAAPAPKAALSGGGFTLQAAGAPAQSIKFGSPVAVALAAAAKLRGVPLKRGHYDDCGQGTGLDYARYKGGLELTFERGKFVGWELAERGDATLRTSAGIGLGSTVTQLRKAYPNVFVDPGNEEDGGFGPTFQLDDGPNGFLDGDRVTSKVIKLYAGAVCIVN